MVLFRRLALASAILTYLLIVVGGIVWVTGSGLGCPDWPTCHGQVVPPLVLQAMVESSHRYTASLASLGIVATGVYAWARFRHLGWVVVPAVTAVGLLVVQIALGAFTVELELTPVLVTAHLGTALLVFAAILVTAVAARWAVVPQRHFQIDGFAVLALATTLATYGLLLAGAFVIKGGSSFACSAWPLCGDGWQLPADRPSLLNFTHRLFAVVAAGLYLALVGRAPRSRPEETTLRTLLLADLALLVAQVAVGAGVVLWRVPPATAALHLAVASAFWGLLLAASVLSCFPLRPAIARTGRMPYNYTNLAVSETRK
jgi:heme A synthase